MKNYDVINLTYDQGLNLVKVFGENIRDFVPILPKFVCKVTKGENTMDMCFDYDENSTKLRVKFYYDEEYVASWEFFAFEENGKTMGKTENLEAVSREWLLELKRPRFLDDHILFLSNTNSNLFYAINNCLANMGYDAFDTAEVKECHRSKHKAKGKSHKSVVRLYKCYKLKKDWKNTPKIPHKINCPAWGVRGHYRHYRSGKVVFIKAFTKGKHRDKYSPKEYKLMPNNNG